MRFGLGAPDAFKRLRKLGLSRLGVKLQGLVLFGKSLELLLHLAYSGFMLLPSNALLAALSLPSESTFLRVATSVVAPGKSMMILLLYIRIPF